MNYTLDDLPKRPANYRAMSETDYKAYTAELQRVAMSRAIPNDVRREALDRLIDAQSILWPSTLANGIRPYVYAQARQEAA